MNDAWFRSFTKGPNFATWVWRDAWGYKYEQCFAGQTLLSLAVVDDFGNLVLTDQLQP